MEIRLQLGKKAAICLKWINLSAFVDSIQLVLWALYLWHLYTIGS